MSRRSAAAFRALAAAAVLLAAGAAAASQWGGHYGTIHLSFTPGPGITPTAEVASEGGAGVLVNVHAILTDVDPITYEGERVLAVGGFELRLGVEGADDARIVSKDISVKNFDIGQEPATVQAGLYPDLPLVDGYATLVTWQVFIPGAERPVRFVLEPEGAPSIRSLGEAAVASGTYAVWSGSMQLSQEDLLFSAGFVPAYLNWEGEPDLSVVRGKGDWSDTGLFELAE